VSKNKRTINYAITNCEFHYLAGIIDASSSFNIQEQACGRKNKTTGKYALRWVCGIHIQNVSPIFIQGIINLLFLGDSAIHVLNVKASGHSHRKISAVRLTADILDFILPKIIPILRGKKQHAEILYEYRKTVTEERYHSQNPTPDHIQKYREKLRAQLKYLNSKEYKDTIAPPLQLPNAKCCGICVNNMEKPQ
jgi:hypothetical protein